MKAAYVADTWRRLLAKQFSVRYERLSFQHVKRIGAATIEFKPGITAIIGGNGVGKSTVMSTIIRSLGGVDSSYSANLFVSENVQVNGTLAVTQNDVVSTSLRGNGVAVTPENAQLPKHKWIDPSTAATQVKDKILSDADFEENLEGIDPQRLSEEECRTLSYIVGKEYQEIEVFDEIEYARGTIPYFRVKVSDNSVYDSAQMGLGELSLFLIYWELRSVERNSIVLIEEPETHISPKSQQHLINFCAKMSLEKGLHLILTTHSPFIIWRLPSSHIRLLTRNGENVGVTSSPTHNQIAIILGDRLDYHGALLVEDELAKEVLLAIVRILAPELLEYYEVVNAKSDEGVRVCIDRLPELKSWCSLVGVFDADQGEKLKNGHFTWPHALLPGEQAPEDLLRQVLEAHRARLALTWGYGEEKLAIVCDSAQGLEKHDWIRKVREGLSLSLSVFVNAIIQVWLEEPESRAKCEALIAKLRDRAFLIKNPE